MENFLNNDNFMVFFREYLYDTTDTKYRSLYFHPEWFVNYKSNDELMIGSEYWKDHFYFMQCLKALKLNLYHYENEIILDKTVFFNKLITNLFINNYIFVDNSISKDIIKHNIIRSSLFNNRLLNDINFYSISYEFLFDGDDNINNLLFSDNTSNFYIFSNEVNQNDINKGYDFLKEQNYAMNTVFDKEILSLIGKFYSNNILLDNENIMC